MGALLKDVLQMEFMFHEGGMTADASIMFWEPLDTFIKPEENEFVGLSFEQWVNPETNFRCMEGWLMAAVPKHPFVAGIRQEMIEHLHSKKDQREYGPMRKKEGVVLHRQENSHWVMYHMHAYVMHKNPE